MPDPPSFDNPALAAARRYVAAGLSVLPINPGGDKDPNTRAVKATIGTTNLTTFNTNRIATDRELEVWFGSGENGIGIFGGAVSGNLTIIDFDDGDTYDTFRGLWDATRANTPLPDFPIVKSPRDGGGMHIYIRTDTAPRTSFDLAFRIEAGTGRRKALIQTRGHHGYVLAPGSPATCHKTGRPYTLVSGDFDNIPIVSQEFLEWIFECATALTIAPEVEVSEPRERGRPPKGGRPGDAYNEAVDLRSLMAQDFRLVYTRGIKEYWCRHDKPHGVSATINHNGENNRAWIFTSSTIYPANRGYDAYGLYTFKYHNGDFKASRADLSKQGYGKQSTWVEPTATPTDEDAPPILRQRLEIVEGGTKGTEGKLSPAIETVIDEQRPLKGIAQDEPPSAVSDLELATEWSESVKDKWLYVWGDQWWTYGAGQWTYSSLEAVQRDLQEWLIVKSRKDHVTVTARKVNSVIAMARLMLGPVELSRFDSSVDWIPLRNGVYELSSGKLLPHTPGRYLTRQLPYDYNPMADAPRWRKFLREMLIDADAKPAEEWIQVMQEWFGYCLVPDCSAQAAMFWIGEGGNGKGTATRALEGMIGEDAVCAVSLAMLHDPNHLADIHGKLAWFIDEPHPVDMKKNGGSFKKIVGGDPISAKRVYEKVFKFRPYCRVILTCNQLPKASDPTRGYFRRVILIEWRKNISRGEADKKLDATLRAELPGIFNWAVDGLRRLRERDGTLIESEESAALLEEYRQSEDSFTAFVLERYRRTGKTEHRMASSEIYLAYKGWCVAKRETAISKRAAGLKLTGMGFRQATERYPTTTNNPTKIWQRIRAREADEPDVETIEDLGPVTEDPKPDLFVTQGTSIDASIIDDPFADED